MRLALEGKIRLVTKVSAVFVLYISSIIATTYSLLAVKPFYVVAMQEFCQVLFAVALSIILRVREPKLIRMAMNGNGQIVLRTEGDAVEPAVVAAPKVPK